MNIPNENLEHVCQLLCVVSNSYKDLPIGEELITMQYITSKMFGITAYALDNLVKQTIKDTQEEYWGNKLLSQVRETLNAQR